MELPKAELGGRHHLSFAPGKRALNRPQNTSMMYTIYIHEPEKAFSFTRLPISFLIDCYIPALEQRSEGAVCLCPAPWSSRKNGWADEYGRVYRTTPIPPGGRFAPLRAQKAVNTLRELQYAGLVEIQKQGCGKPNRIYPKSYEAVPNTDFKKSGYGTPEGLKTVLGEYENQSS